MYKFVIVWYPVGAVGSLQLLQRLRVDIDAKYFGKFWDLAAVRLNKIELSISSWGSLLHFGLCTIKERRNNAEHVYMTKFSS